MAKLLDAIRRAIETSGQSRYEIAKGADVAQSQLSRFMSRESQLTVETAERLADYLGLEVVVKVKRSWTDAKTRIRG